MNESDEDRIRLSDYLILFTCKGYPMVRRQIGQILIGVKITSTSELYTVNETF